MENKECCSSRSNLLETRRGTHEYVWNKGMFFSHFVALNFKAKPFVIKINLMAVRFYWRIYKAVFFSMLIFLLFETNQSRYYCSNKQNFFHLFLLSGWILVGAQRYQVCSQSMLSPISSPRFPPPSPPLLCFFFPLNK